MYNFYYSRRMEVWTGSADAPLDETWPAFRPGAAVTLRATLSDRLGQRWASEVGAVADQRGAVALNASVDDEPDALIWSMALQPPPGRPPMPYVDACTDGLEALEIELTADGRRGRLLRRLVAADIEVTVVQGTGFAATVFTPVEAAPDRWALALGGSGGATSWSWQVAALLAAHGRRAAAVAYFDWSGQLGLPQSITELPIELVVRAAAAIDPGRRLRVDLIGFSKGAELALNAASRLELPLATVTAVAPSSHSWEAATSTPDGNPRGSWTQHGTTLPFLRFNAPPDFYASFDKTSLGPLHDRALDGTDAKHPARIPTERITAPLLLVAGTEDSTWPSARMTAGIASTRTDARQLIIDRAGHTITPPGLPVTPLDGHPAANARANRAMWRILQHHLALPS
ncbi:alpha/beta fold hydrolase [Geodermatophilus sp. DSM 44513]|uniref:alpha/beta fold hydrolase n=1 Tax=Geodermatophilus sp. DSM 44513 TaxID=1528104 RepID=UPI0012854C2C|nr:alpha/beta fold hydrolase [Geodermatophilus sp. DSM 44513]WNV75169.1 acyl-CoA thioester hydrolase/BAAT C-terminal domain-containing protein [Geodermatophilus sp. DSM 44513]